MQPTTNNKNQCISNQWLQSSAYYARLKIALRESSEEIVMEVQMRKSPLWCINVPEGSHYPTMLQTLHQRIRAAKLWLSLRQHKIANLSRKRSQRHGFKASTPSTRKLTKKVLIMKYHTWIQSHSGRAQKGLKSQSSEFIRLAKLPSSGAHQ